MAAVAVVFAHADVPFFKNGGIGVDVFFALSGFLITSLLVEELVGDGRVALRAFWLRRVLRLVPALVVLVAVVGALAPIMPAGTTDGILPTLLYVSNWWRAFVDDAGALGHTWSLGIEEQFYLLWPLVLIPLWRLNRSIGVALWVTLVVAASVAVLRELAVQTEYVSRDRWYNGFEYRADAILIGCALALAVHAGRLPRWLSDPRAAWAMLAACILVRPFFFVIWGATPAAEHTVAAGATAVIIGCIISGTTPRLSRHLSHPLARWVGVRSYGLYLWHYPICRVLVDGAETPTRTVLALMLSFAAAAASYRYVEAPFLRLKGRVGHRPRPDAAPDPLAAANAGAA